MDGSSNHIVPSNLKNLDSALSILALGFYPKMYDDVLDLVLPTPKHIVTTLLTNSSIQTVNLMDYGTCSQTKTKGVRMFHLSSPHRMQQLCDALNDHSYKAFNTLHGHSVTKHFNHVLPGQTQQNYIVKQTHVSTYRQLLTCLKEAIMTSEFYTVSTTVGGSTNTNVCKPYFAGLCWTGKCWTYIIGMDMAPGKTLKTLMKKLHHSKCLMKPQKHGVDKTKLVCALRTSLHWLWWLGYSHNNLNDSNVLYDETKNVITFINLGAMVALPLIDVVKFRDAMWQTHVQSMVADEIDMFRHIHKATAISLSALADKHIIVDAMITDDHFAKAVMKALN